MFCECHIFKYILEEIDSCLLLYLVSQYMIKVCFSSMILIITNAHSINELRGVTGRVDVVHSIYI